jgi:hypothetical protein
MIFFLYTSSSFIRRWIWLWWFIPATSRTSSVLGARRIHHLNRWRHYTQCEFRCSSRSTHHWSRQLHYLRSLIYIYLSILKWKLNSKIFSSGLFIYLLASHFGRWWMAYLYRLSFAFITRSFGLRLTLMGNHFRCSGVD